MKNHTFPFRKILTVILLIILASGVIYAQEKPVIGQPDQGGSISVPEIDSKISDQQGDKTGESDATIQGSKPAGTEQAARATEVTTTKPKQVKPSRPVMSQTKGARPPTIIRPSGSGIPKGTGNPGGAVGPGRR